MNLIFLIPICAVAYMIGNINLAILSTRRKSDIRKLASGNPGASNMLRSFGFKRAIIVFLFDVAKGVLPVLIVYLIWGDRLVMHATALAVVLGHCFPVLFHFKGGKGVATMVGAFLVISPVFAVIGFVAGLLYAFVFDYAAVSSLLFINIVVFRQLFQETALAIHLILVGFYILVLYTHRTNIIRLLTGQENKAKILGRKKGVKGGK